MPKKTKTTSWLNHCPKPRPRPPGIDWDVFISYRSADRPWALNLYDMLVQAGYTVFLDQFVLIPGQGLTSQLSGALEASASGVLLWSSRTADSAWVQREIDAMSAMAAEAREARFHYLVAKLDGTRVPRLLAGDLYVDFSAYPDGPTGAELVRLLCGLVGQAPQPAAVKRIAEYEAAVASEAVVLRAARDEGLSDVIVDRAMAGGDAYATAASLWALAAEALTAVKRPDDALRVLDKALAVFPASVRLRQMRGHALRRVKRVDEAILALGVLRQEGHRDPETLGILAACYADRWTATGKREALERSRLVYAESFQLVPSDTYVGINAASKSAMLDELATAQPLAQAVLNRLVEIRKEKGGLAHDYWLQATEPEALLLLGRWDDAIAGFHAAKIAHIAEAGSIGSTAVQVRRLIPHLPITADAAERLLAEFEGFGDSA